jgi:hypothetical protein
MPRGTPVTPSCPGGRTIKNGNGLSDVRTTSRKRVVHQALTPHGRGRGCVQASMIAQSVGCSLGCSHSQLGKPVKPLVRWCFRLRYSRLRAPFVAFPEGRGPCGARAFDQDGQRRSRRRHEAAAIAAKWLNVLRGNQRRKRGRYTRIRSEVPCVRDALPADPIPNSGTRPPCSARC